jgi:hypothetical protein
MSRRACLVLLAACGGGGGDAPDAGGDAHVPTESHTLGLNDVTMLLPLPASPSAPVLMSIDGLVPTALYDRLAIGPGDVATPFEDFHVVAVRFDLCDRGEPGECPVGVDGRVRLVLQPLLATGEAFDLALHAFYPISAAELGGVVDELRALAAIQDVPTTSALAVSPAAVRGDAGYLDGLRALVVRYASEDRLMRLTLFAQNAFTASLNWAFRGVERHDLTSAFEDMVIPGIGTPQQRAILIGASTAITYDTMPLADAPPGFGDAIYADRFMAASPAERTAALEALAAADNPLVHAANSVQCIACHTETFLTQQRAAAAGVDPSTIAGRYTSTYPLATSGGMSATNERSLRALGWLFAEPMISQRVVNDTAQVLTEIEARFPPAD